MVKAIVSSEVTMVKDGATLGVFTFDGTKLNGPKGSKIEFSTDEKRKKIADAVSAYRPDRYVTKMGYEMTEEDRAEGGWEFVGTVADAHGQYSRCIRGTGPIEVVLK